jgi:hypothetical protein
MKSLKVIVMLLMVMVIILVGFSGCTPRIDTSVVEELEAQLAEKEKLLQEKDDLLEEKDAEITKIKEQCSFIVEDQQLFSDKYTRVYFDDAENGDFAKLKETLNKYYPQVNPVIGTRSYKKLGYLEFTSLTNCEKFLKSDLTNLVGFYKYDPPYNYSDELAFKLKYRWIEAELPGGSLGLLKGKRTFQSGEGVHWRNLFIEKTKSGEFLLYEIIPSTDEIIPVQEPNEETYFIELMNVL